MELGFKNNEKSYWGIFIVVALFLISLETLIVASINQSLIILLAINFIFFFTGFFIIYLKDLPTFLIILNIIPLMYLNNEFHYYINWILVQDSFLFILIYLTFLKSLNFNNIISYSSIKKPLIIMFCYFLFSAIYGLIKGHNALAIINELYHFFYYLLAIIFLYVLDKRKYYLVLMGVIIFIVTIVSLEYIFIYLSGYSRTVTFQSTLLVILISIALSFILLYNKYRLFWTTVYLLGAVSLIISQTRSLWASVFISSVVIIFFYLKETHKNILVKIIFYSLILIIPALVFSARSSLNTQRIQSNQGIESRTQSISNPTEDVSFVMRLELGYYAVQKFLKHPIVGNGLGDYVQYKIFDTSRSKVYYLDNTWLYLLWKGGIIGFILFVWVYLIFLKNTWFVYKNTTEPKVAILSLGIFASFIGLIISGFFAATLIKYKYGVIIAIIIAFIEFEKSKIRSEIINNRD